ncbi:related to lipid A export ATP-binding/permease protein msbA [Rhynchosporium agropyri]|uniref:Related to lipid A export ATP-binding/permease protein msbA n=1 Tax=Rhynchosporium agropyri TaxID=914238 RepID=A0A1E1K1M5_9HELO|nr:related to lipid A export ATP-binding/permease protein msbA [Rhynchosporium agropyri]
MGRVLNRFTGDFINLDSSLAGKFSRFAGAITQTIGIMVAAIFVSPFILICAVVLLLGCMYFGKTFLAAARTVKRLESTNKSPVISYFAASSNGLSTIRAFAKTSDFKNRMFTLIDGYAACTWHTSLLQNWLRIRIAATTSLFAGTVATFVIKKRGIDASLAGFALSFALNFGSKVKEVINVSTLLELDMNATERVFEYRDLKIEDQGGDEVRATWPEVGKVEVMGLELGYAEDLPAILKGLTFTAEGNLGIGVIVRTGAGKDHITVQTRPRNHFTLLQYAALTISGKSTLSLALFRFLAARKGSIKIDGVEVSTIKLYDLRKRLAIIPQDPVLFSGTIRSNLDPFSEFSDYQLREALMRVHLLPTATHTPKPQLQNVSSSSSSTAINTSSTTENKTRFLSLSSPIASSGSNLSHGQRQLLCLARAILSRPKVLILDEATSAVDMATDLLIQRSIREEFANTTLLVIAHRLSTVADFDKILVMSEGREKEFGTPRELLEKEGEEAIFRGMVEMSGEKEESEKMCWSIVISP